MMPKIRERSGSELVFSVLKLLMIGYQLWGAESGVDVTELCGVLRTTDARIGGVVAFLAGEGLVSRDETSGSVRLTDVGARNLLSISHNALG